MRAAAAGTRSPSIATSSPAPVRLLSTPSCAMPCALNSLRITHIQHTTSAPPLILLPLLCITRRCCFRYRREDAIGLTSLNSGYQRLGSVKWSVWDVWRMEGAPTVGDLFTFLRAKGVDVSQIQGVSAAAHVLAPVGRPIIDSHAFDSARRLLLTPHPDQLCWGCIFSTRHPPLPP